MERAGIYIHIPFCLSRCSYCDFATEHYDKAAAERYILAVCAEIAKSDIPNTRQVDTIYFGGGTPSLLTTKQLKALIESVRERFDITKAAEVTMEMNPGTLSPAVLRAFRQYGVTRASFGAQTFDDQELRRLGRRHTAADVRTTILSLRDAGYCNVSFDLIAGLPAQTLEGWSRNIDQALDLQPEHLSLYLLEVHEGTPLAQQIARGVEPKPDDDTAASMYQLMLEKCSNAGYIHYEISNFCAPGYESRHNTKYWTRDPVYGFGCAAHSHDGHRRRWSNERNATKYVEMVEKEGRAVVESVALTDAEVRSEAVFLGLRLLRGVSFAEHSAQYGEDLWMKHREDLQRLEEAGLVDIGDGTLRLTPSGALLSNEVFSIFV